MIVTNFNAAFKPEFASPSLPLISALIHFDLMQVNERDLNAMQGLVSPAEQQHAVVFFPLCKSNGNDFTYASKYTNDCQTNNTYYFICSFSAGFFGEMYGPALYDDKMCKVHIIWS